VFSIKAASVRKSGRPSAEDKALVQQWLPKGRESFSVRELAQIFDHSEQHMQNLIDDGCLTVVDPTAKRSMRRVTRDSLGKFLISRTVRHKPTKQKGKL
jgi:hypothetical protein